MSKIVFAIVVVCLAQIAVARNVREAPTENGLTAIWNSANETFIALNAAFLRVVDAGSNEELVEKVSNQFKTLANEVEANVNKLTEEAKPLTGKAGEYVKSFTEEVTKIGEKLKAQNPEFVDKNIRAISDEVAKLNARLQKEEAVISEKAQGFIRVISDNTIAAANQIKAQIETAIAPKKN